MREARVLAGREAALADHALASGGGEQRLERRLVPAFHRRERPQAELLAQHRRGLDQRPHLRRQSIEPGTGGGRERRRQDQPLGGTPGRAALDDPAGDEPFGIVPLPRRLVFAPHQQAALEEEPDGLHQEVGIAAGELVERRGDRRAAACSPRCAEHPRDLGPHLRLGERAQTNAGEAARRRLLPDPDGQRVGLLLGFLQPSESDDQERIVDGGAHQVADHLPARVVGPLEIVEQEHQRTFPAQLAEAAAKGSAHLAGIGRRPHRTAAGRMTQLRREGDAEPRADPLRERQLGVGITGAFGLQRGAEQVEQGLVGRELAALVVEEVGDEAAGAFGPHGAGEVPRELRLPDARLAEDEDRLAAARERAAQLGAQKLEHVIAADELVEVGIGRGWMGRGFDRRGTRHESGHGDPPRRRRGQALPDGLVELTGLGRGIGGELGAQSLGELLVGPERARPVPDAVEQAHQPAHAALVVGCERDRAPGPRCTLRRLPLPFRPLGHGPGRQGGDGPEPRAPRLEPRLELRGDAGDEEPGEEVATVEIERGLVAAAVECLLEGRGVTPQQRRIEPDVLVTPPDDDRTQPLAKEVERLSQGVAALGQVQLGPEQTQQGVAAVEAEGTGGGEVGEEGEPLGL